MNSFARRESFELSDLEVKMTREESFQSDVERKSGGAPTLAATLMDDGKSRGGKKKGKHQGS